MQPIKVQQKAELAQKGAQATFQTGLLNQSTSLPGSIVSGRVQSDNFRPENILTSFQAP